MPIDITHDIQVSVETIYQGFHIVQHFGQHVFSYRITIKNHGDHPVKLLRRHWHIVESNGTERQVEGEGVVGETPLIQPNSVYVYSSGCNLVMDIGKMFGDYTFERQHDGKLFQVEIPEFILIAPFRSN
ncbi:MAG: Co2+/Mg2+ efflux protein ApaG [Flavobacteriaceae bacterium]|nr:Co2+/Mg2+ efflux protein ApaG [Flavobacteriaceae bacterium]